MFCGPSSRAIDCATARSPNVALAKAAKPLPPRKEAVAPVKKMLPLSGRHNRFAAAPFRNRVVGSEYSEWITPGVMYRGAPAIVLAVDGRGSRRSAPRRSFTRADRPSISPAPSGFGAADGARAARATSSSPRDRFLTRRQRFAAFASAKIGLARWAAIDGARARARKHHVAH